MKTKKTKVKTSGINKGKYVILILKEECAHPHVNIASWIRQCGRKGRRERRKERRK